jgi:hypothetical protein
MEEPQALLTGEAKFAAIGAVGNKQFHGSHHGPKYRPLGHEAWALGRCSGSASIA